MRRSGWLVRVLVGLAVLSHPLQAEAGDDQERFRQEVDALVANLSAESEQTKETAKRGLLALGEQISPMLKERLERTADPALRFMLQRVLTLLPLVDDARNVGVEVETYACCKELIDTLTTPGAPQAVATLLGSAEEVFPILIAELNDFRPMGVDSISFATGPDAPEGLLHYGPEIVVDCITIMLSMTSDQSFGFLHNGGTDEKRREVIRKWKDWYKKARPFLVWDPARHRYIVDDAAWVTEVPVEKYRRLSETRQAEALDRAFKKRDRVLQEFTGIVPIPPEGALETLIDALREDPYQAPTFDSPPWVSASIKKLAARDEDILPAMAFTYHRTFDRPLSTSIIATIGELGGKTATKVLKAWMAFEHRQFCKHMIERTLAKMK